MSDSPEANSRHELTRVVRDLARGKTGDEASLLPVLLQELKSIAEGHLRLQRPGHTLQASALVNEAYLKLFESSSLQIKDRLHFFALASKAMRQVLVDHARSRKRDKRGGTSDPVTLSSPVARSNSVVDVLDLHLALEELSERDQRQGRIVELRYFGGLEVADVANLLGVSKTTVEGEWRSARAWLGSRLKKGTGIES